MENNLNTETRKPPVATTGFIGWFRQHLFSNWINSIITILVIYFLYQLIPWFLDWFCSALIFGQIIKEN